MGKKLREFNQKTYEQFIKEKVITKEAEKKRPPAASYGTHPVSGSPITGKKAYPREGIVVIANDEEGEHIIRPAP